MYNKGKKIIINIILFRFLKNKKQFQPQNNKLIWPYEDERESRNEISFFQIILLL